MNNNVMICNKYLNYEEIRRDAVYAVRLFYVGSIAQAWLEECFSQFTRAIREGQKDIRRDKDTPGQGEFCLPENLVDRYTAMPANQFSDIKHLQGACNCMARKYGFAGAKLEFDENTEYIDLVVQA